MKFRVTITFEYGTNPIAYPVGSTVEQMTQLDKHNLEDDPSIISELLSANDYKVEIEEVK